jgi:hypothetical protein
LARVIDPLGSWTVVGRHPGAHIQLEAYKLGLFHAAFHKKDGRGSVTATVARHGLPDKMADDDLVCPPPFPPEVIRHAVWLYARFTLSYRDVEDLLAERGLDVSYETVRRWVLKFGPCSLENFAVDALGPRRNGI